MRMRHLILGLTSLTLLTVSVRAQTNASRSFSRDDDETITFTASNNNSASPTKTYYTTNGGQSSSSGRPGWNSPAETRTRTVRIKVPDATRPSGGYPIIIWLHGDNTETDVLNLDLWDKVENVLKPVIVMPRGTLPVDIGSNRVPSAYNKYTWNNAPYADNHNMMTSANRVVKEDDIDFIDSLIDYMTSCTMDSNNLIDPDKIYIGGHSSGGFLTYAVAARRSDLAGITISGAGIRSPVSLRKTVGNKVTVQQWGGFETVSDYTSAVSNKTSVVIFHGKLDTSVEFDGRTLNISAGETVVDPMTNQRITGNVKYYWSAEDVLEAWTTINEVGNAEYETAGDGIYYSGTRSSGQVTIGDSPHSLKGAPNASSYFTTLNTIDEGGHVSFTNNDKAGLLLRFGLLFNGYPAGVVEK